MNKLGVRDDESLEWSDWPMRGWAFGRLLVAYLVLVAVGLGVGGLLVHTPVGQPIVDEEIEVSEWIATEREPAVTEMSLWASRLGGTIPVVTIVVALSIAFALAFKRWRESASLATALSLEALVFLTVSTLVGRSRPPVEQLDVSPPTASFPSGHAGAATALYLTLSVIVWWRIKNAILRGLAALLAVALPASVAISRVYRGMHFVTDVIVGMLLGAAAAWVAIRIVVAASERQGT